MSSYLSDDTFIFTVITALSTDRQTEYRTTSEEGIGYISWIAIGKYKDRKIGNVKKKNKYIR